jgi:hypothetical protein
MAMVAGRTSLGLVVCAAVLGLAGCEGDSVEATGGAGGEGGGPSVGPVTFHKDVEPILQNNCLSCHYEGKIGGFSLVTYEEAEPMSGLIAAVTEQGLMPPWGAHTTDECEPRLPYKDDLRLSAEELAILRAWDDQGAPQGDPADAPPPFQPPAEGLANADLDLVPNEMSTVAGESDQFVCVVYDPALTEDKWVDGVHFIAGDPTVAHHALTFRASRNDAIDLSGGNERFECFGAPAGELIHAWAPGGLPLEMPENVGIKLTPDDVIIVQMHYHPTPGETKQDASTIQLRFTDTDPEYGFMVALPGNAEDEGDGLLPGPNDAGAPEFRVPANTKDHTETMEVVVPTEFFVDVPILMVAPHMHYVGVDLKFEIHRATLPASQPQDECFVHNTAWDFGWQRFYQFDVPIAELPTVKAGDVLTITCKYNNTMSNPFLQKALAEQGEAAPIDVTLGEETLDEMCLVGVGLVVPAAFL